MVENVRAVLFDSVEIFGKSAVFADIRLNRASIPDGFHVYDLRHGDHWDKPCTLENHVAVNYYGTVIVNRPIALGKNGYRRIQKSDFKKTSNKGCTFDDYEKKHPPRKREKER